MSSITVFAQDATEQKGMQKGEENPRVILSLVHCWYKGNVAYYIQTEASDAGLAQQQGVNYVPLLANVLSAKSVAFR